MNAAEALADLNERANQKPHAALQRPVALPVTAVEVLPVLFQPRSGIDELHVNELVKALKAFGELDPITVMAVGSTWVLVDGHHRLEAYKHLRGADTAIPVAYFEGTPNEAVLASGEANSKAKLPMSSRERQDFAWRLVTIDGHSIAQIARASGTSTAQVSIMRRVRKALGEDAASYSSWWKAKRASKGVEFDPDPEALETWKHERASRIADVLAKNFSTQLANDPEITALAFSMYFGRKLPELVEELADYVPERDGADDLDLF